MIKSIYPLVAVCVLALLVAGCGLAPNQDKAKAVVKKHFKYISQKQFGLATEQYSPIFFEKTPKEKWKKMLATISKKLGDYKDYSIVGFRLNTGSTPVGTGTMLVYQCRVIYSKYDADETLTLFKGREDKDYQIVGHHFNSNGFLLE